MITWSRTCYRCGGTVGVIEKSSSGEETKKILEAVVLDSY